jgi:hypothetical protein
MTTLTICKPALTGTLLVAVVVTAEISANGSSDFSN